LPLLSTPDQRLPSQLRSIAAADGRFNHISRVTPLCPHWRAHCRHVANTIYPVLPLAHTQVHTANGKLVVQPFLHSSRQKVSILYNGRPFPSKLPISIGGSGPPSNALIPCAHWSPQPKRHLDLLAVFEGLSSVTDRPTDHATRSVTKDRIYVRSTAMRPKMHFRLPVGCVVQR